MNPENNNPQESAPNLEKLEKDLQEMSPPENVQAIPSSTRNVQLQDTATEPRKSSTLILVAVVMVVAALVLAAAYIFGSRFFGANPAQVACTMDAKICPDGSAVGREGPNCEFAACPVATATPDPTANWETYTNEMFTFKYPQEYSINNTSNVKFITISSENTQINIDWRQTTTNGSIDNVVEKYKSELANTSEKQLSLGIQITGTTKAFGEGISAGEKTRSAIIGKDKYVVILTETPSIAFPSDAFDQILSTFKFLEATPLGSPSASPSASPTSTPL